MTDKYIGQQFGNYQLLRLLGEGNFAAVYLAEHRFLEVPRAVKLLKTKIDATTHKNFHREARIIAHLQHPHIVQVYDFGTEEGVPYLVMEYMGHGTMRSLYPKGTRVPLEQIVIYTKQIAAALDYAHGQRVIHRDIKPENILLNAKQEAVLSDFGIAVMQQTMDSDSQSRPAGGTPLYMAPEQIASRPCPASDQYALGVLVYEWITGEPPFRGSTIFEIWSQHVYAKPPSLRDHVPQLPAAVEDAVLGALAKNPEERFATALDFAIVLEEACFATLPQLFSVRTEGASSLEAASPAIPARREMAAQRNQVVAMPPQPTNPPYPEKLSEFVKESTALIGTQYQRGLKQLRAPVALANRRRLLLKVRSFWIEGLLQRSLHGAALIATGLEELPAAVANPWSLVLQSPDASARPLPAGTRISQVYDKANGELLILGAPGSGKTTLLLELAQDLLERAEHDEAHPMPVVFNLSSWALKRQPLADWLVEELLSKYQVPRKLGRRLVDADQILPLLDGLDEVAPQARTACIDAINSYRQEHGLLPMVVCSRRADYLALTTRIQLDCAVVVQPLTNQQIDMYVQHAGAPLRALRLALQHDVEMRELARTPLMLSILTLTYHGMPVEQSLRPLSSGMQQREVFARYVQRMLTSRSTQAPYTQQQTIHLLSWLARQLAHRNQTVFSLERMQPDWLEGRWAQRRYPRVAAGLIFGVIGLLCLSPLSGFLTMQPAMLPAQNIAALGISILWGLLIGALFGFMHGLISGPGETFQKERRWSWGRGMWRLARGVVSGGFIGLALGLPYGLSILGHQPVGAENTFMFIVVLLMGLLSGAIFILVDAFLGIHSAEIRPMETFVWSWTRMVRSCVKFLCLGLLGLLLIGLLFGLIGGLYSDYTKHWTVNIFTLLSYAWTGGRTFISFFGVFFALLCGLTGALTGGLSGDRLEAQRLITPNQGIHRSARHSILIGSIGSIVGGIAGGWLGYMIEPNHNLTVFVIFALIFGPLIGVVSGLRAGGAACLQHLVLRWLLWETGSAPWHYARFLDYAAERVLLRKVGGGYIFVHRLLLEYFASLETSRQTH